MIATLAFLAVTLGQEPAKTVDPLDAEIKVVLDSVKDPRQKADIERDIKQGRDYITEVNKEYKKSENAEQQARLNRVGSEMAKIALSYHANATWGDKRLNPFPYQFTLLKGDDVNAFSLPGGFIYVFDGLMKLVESDDELAGVLAHEISHASFRHIATMEREARKLETITIPAILVAIFAGGDATGSILTGVQLGNTAMGSGWSVKAEEAADYGGLQYILQSKYRPSGMLTMLEKLANKDKIVDSIDWGILRTHPPSKERALAMLQRFKDGKIPVRRSETAKSFAVQVKTVDSGAELWFGQTKLAVFTGDSATDRASTAQIKLNEFFDAVPGLFEIAADSSGAVVGRHVRLFGYTQMDAESQKSSVQALAKGSVDSIKRSLYALSMKIWNP